MGLCAFYHPMLSENQRSSDQRNLIQDYPLSWVEPPGRTTGMARPNSGIYEELVREKNDDGKVSEMYEINAAKATPTPDNQVPTLDTFQ